MKKEQIIDPILVECTDCQRNFYINKKELKKTRCAYCAKGHKCPEGKVQIPNNRHLVNA